MAERSRTQVGIIGAGRPACCCRTCWRCAASTRWSSSCAAGPTARPGSAPGCWSRAAPTCCARPGLGARLDAEGLEHGGIYLQFGGERHHLDFRDLTGGASVTVYAQTEVVKDLIAARLAAGAALEFEVTGTSVDDIGHRPAGAALHGRRRHRARGDLRRHRGLRRVPRHQPARGAGRPAGAPRRAHSVYERAYPYSWLGILASVAAVHRRADLLPPRPRLRPAQPAQPAGQPALPAGARRRPTSRTGPTTGSGPSCRPGSGCRAGTSRRARCWRRASPRCAATSASRCAADGCSWPATRPTSCRRPGPRASTWRWPTWRCWPTRWPRCWTAGPSWPTPTRAPAWTGSGGPPTSPGG